MEKRKIQMHLMHQLILDDSICESVRGQLSYLLGTEYANWKAQLKLNWVYFN